MKNEMKYQEIISFVHKNLFIIFLVIIFIQVLFFEDERNYLLIGLVILGYLLESFFNARDDYKTKKTIIISKYLQAICCTFAFLSDSIQVNTIALSILFIVVLELLIFNKKFSQKDSMHIVLLITIPVVIVNFLIMVFLGDTIYHINRYLTIVIFSFFLNGFIYIFNYFYENILNDHEKLEKNYQLACNSLTEMKETHEKYMEAHSQLSMQKSNYELAYKKLNRASSEMYIQNELLKYISSVLDIEELMEMVTDSIIGAIGVDTCSIIVYSETKDCYQLKIKSVFKKDYTPSFKKALSIGQLDSFFESTKLFTDNNVKPNKYNFLMDRNVGSLLVMPLVRKNITYGLLIAEQRTENTYIDNIQFFEGIATQINIAIENANLYAKMEDMAIKDGLTGVYNRSYLQKSLKDIISDSIVSKKVLSIAMFDIDKFKNVNDTYGHLFGDEVIIAFAEIAEKLAILHNGIVGRYGGEEFVIIFKDMSEKETYPVVEEIHAQIKAHKFYYEGKEIHLNASFGITSYPSLCNNPADLLKRVDLALYYSKENGRGRITIDNENI